MGETQTPPIANDFEGAHSLHQLVGLLARAVIEADPPQCLTPARCMMRHGPHCRVTRWENISEAIRIEWLKQSNEKGQERLPGSSDLLAVLADRIESQKYSYHLAHKKLVTHVFETIAKEIRAVAKEARSKANDQVELSPREAPESNSELNSG